MNIPTSPEEAISLNQSPEWAAASDLEKSRVQIDCQWCIFKNLSELHESMEDALGRPVWTHEFALNREGLRRELFGDEAATPTMQEIIEMVPEGKRLVVVS